MKKILIALGILFLCGLGLFTIKSHAAELDITISASDGSDGQDLLDEDPWSQEPFEVGTTVTIQAQEPIDSLYIKWGGKEPSPCTLDDGGNTVPIGEDGFLHEYVKLSGTSNSVTITIKEDDTTFADIFAFSAGELPDYVQQWKQPWDKADILVIPAHADDEALFFSGIIPIYTNENRARVQAVLFSDHVTTGEHWRPHEFLDSLWVLGVDHYPVFGPFIDEYSESLEEAEGLLDKEEGLEFIVEELRRFKPQVVVTHDRKGEYGHGTHMFVCERLLEALEISQDSSKYPDSAQTYGTWDVPKTYIHLWPENKIETDTRAPLSSFGGKNAFELGKEAYDQHLSQAWTWYYVDDGYDENGNPNGYEYSIAKYGLARTTVGLDSGTNDVMENLVAYDLQSSDPEKQEPQPTEEATTSSPEKQEKKKSGNTALIIVLIAVLLVILLIDILLFALIRKLKKQEEIERLERVRRVDQARRTRPQTSPDQMNQPRRSGQSSRPVRTTSSNQQSRPTRPVQAPRSSQANRETRTSQTRRPRNPR